MVRVAKPVDPKKLAELKKKIKSQAYLDAAIARLANTLTKEIMNLKKD